MAQDIETEHMNLERSRLGTSPHAAFEQVKYLLSLGLIDAARNAVSNINLSHEINVPAQRFHDFSDDERLIYTEARGISVSTPQAIVSLARAVRYVIETNIPGDLVECGVFQGGSILVMIRQLLLMNVTNRNIYLYDTFEGMTKPTEADVYYTGEKALDAWEHLQNNWVKCGLEEVKARIYATGYPQDLIHFIQGPVEQTIPQTTPDSIALLRLDTDFYESTKHELTHLWPLVNQRGIMIIDDYGAFTGSQKATDEYFESIPRPYLNRIDEHVRLAVKP